MKENILNTLHNYEVWDGKSEIACVYLIMFNTKSKPSFYIAATHNLLHEYALTIQNDIDGDNIEKISMLFELGISHQYYILHKFTPTQMDERNIVNWTNHYLDKLFDPYKANLSKLKNKAPTTYNILNNIPKLKVIEMTGGSLNSKQYVKSKVNYSDIRHFEETVEKYMKVMPTTKKIEPLTEEEEKVLELMCYTLLHYDYPVECERCVTINPLNPDERVYDYCYDCEPPLEKEKRDRYETRVKKLQLEADLDIKNIVAHKINTTYDKLQQTLDNIDYKIAMQEEIGEARSVLTKMSLSKLI